MNPLAFQVTPLLTIQTLTISLGAVICLLTLELIRRDLLRLAYALVWLLSGAIVIVIGIFPSILDLLQQITGMNYQTAMLFCVFGFVLLLLMQYSIILSRLSLGNKVLTQEVALLREELRQAAEKPPAPPAADAPRPKN